MTNNTLVYTILIYSDYDSKDKSLIKASYLIFILKTDDVEEDSLQLFYTKFSLISDVATIADNDEIYDISQSDDIVFLKLDLLSTVVEIEIEVRVFLQH